MQSNPNFYGYEDEFVALRRQIHANPELLFDVHETAALVAKKLREFGVDEVVTGIGQTGVVGVIKGSSPGRTIGLRADMDALPIPEETGVEYTSVKPGLMPACGHDGHTAMLLGAAKYLSDTRDFSGTAVVIFQPAEEGGGGGREMVQDGMMERFNIQEVYGLHTFPNTRCGAFAIRSGAALASVDTFEIQIAGKGAHAAKPQASVDPIVIASNIVQSLQSITSRGVDPKEALVVSVTTFNAGQATNVIPQKALLTGTVRSLSAEVRDLAEAQLTRIVTGTAAAHRAVAKVNYTRDYPVMSNHAVQAMIAADVAASLVGDDNVDRDFPSSMGGEDFAFMLQKRPGAMIFMDQGPGPELHNPAFDFNDDVLLTGMSFWVKLMQSRGRV
ncbi:M20 aminoacylase family protein [Parasedimentitalea huanghaiensis]|uniref:Amidohydrolase n=1 Tax=Parasedimentitalea huanghaiensis TaxID=2682100 RepID=A0A6L6WHZ4_9RHOB|nr:M20 aminoacylase family protein [Zongyanglinia huanghaiensis]MVO16579.1 amidohydrolase [Zongyanglinia huanghaiensis]